MPLPKRTVTKSKKDGVKKKTVTYKSKAATATRTKTKSKAGKSKTTTVSNKKGNVVATASKDKGRPVGQVTRKAGAKSTQKSKTVDLGRGRTASTKTAKGRAYYGKGKARELTSGGSGDTYSRTDKSKGRGVGKDKFTTRGTTKQTMRGRKVSGMKTTDTYGRKKPFKRTYKRG